VFVSTVILYWSTEPIDIDLFQSLPRDLLTPHESRQYIEYVCSITLSIALTQYHVFIVTFFLHCECQITKPNRSYPDGPRGAGPPLQGGARGVRDQAEGQWQWAAAGRGPGGEAITEGPVHPRTVHKSCLVP